MITCRDCKDRKALEEEIAKLRALALDARDAVARGDTAGALAILADPLVGKRWPS